MLNIFAQKRSRNQTRRRLHCTGYKIGRRSKTVYTFSCSAHCLLSFRFILFTGPEAIDGRWSGLLQSSLWRLQFPPGIKTEIKKVKPGHMPYALRVESAFKWRHADVYVFVNASGRLARSLCYHMNIRILQPCVMLTCFNPTLAPYKIQPRSPWPQWTKNWTTLRNNSPSKK